MGEPTTATVTLLFCDLVESTALGSQLGDAGADDLRHAVFEQLRDALGAHRGTEVKNLGDGIMASFQSNADAVACSVAMAQAIDALGRERELPLSLRVGISVGEATFEGGDWFGTPVIEASRLCSVAEPGQILVADVVRVLLGTRGEHTVSVAGTRELKGLPDPVAVSEVAWAPLERREIDLGLPRVLELEPRFPIAGRDDELNRVVDAWKAAAQGQLQTVLIAGEPGIGKTRLAAELGRRAHDEGHFVLMGRCDEALSVPYQPFVEALGHVTHHAPPSRLAELLGPGAGELVRLAPDLAQRLPGLERTESVDPESERFLLFEAVSGWLAAQSAIAPVVLVLDDLHWAGEPTLLLLRHLLRSNHEHRLLVIGTYRDTEIDRTHALGDLLADLRRMDRVERIALDGLDRDGVARLLEVAAGHELNEQAMMLAETVHDETGGNPFFAIEVLVHLAERGTIYQGEDGVWRTDLAVDELGIPEGVKEVVGRRLGALGEGTDESLHAASVCGQVFELDVVATMVDASEDSVIDALEAARTAGLVDEIGGRPVRYRFSHALVQQTLLDEIPTARRLRAHRACAEALEALHGDDDAYVSALAHHWYEAGTEPQRAFAALMRAGSDALAQFADREALTLLNHAQELAVDADVDELEAIDLLIARGEAMRRVGNPEHREVLLAARYRSHEAGDPHRAAAAALANGRGWQSNVSAVDTERLDALRSALDEFEEGDSATRASLLSRCAVEMMYAPDRADRFAIADEAIAVARRVGDDSTLAQVLFETHNVYLSPGSMALRSAHYDEITRLTEHLNDPQLEWNQAAIAHFPLMQSGRVDEARAALVDLVAVAERMRRPVDLWVARWQQAAMARVDGDLDAAFALSEEALEIANEAGIPDGANFYFFQRANLHLDRCDPGGSEEMELFASIDTGLYAGPEAIFAIQRLLTDGTGDGVADILERLDTNDLAPWGKDPGPDDSADSWAVGMLTLAAIMGEPAHVERAWKFLEPFADQLYGNVAWAGPCSADLGSVAPLLGKPELMEPLVTASIEFADDRDMPLSGMQNRISAAIGFRLRDEPGDRDRASALADEAIAIGDRIGAGFARQAAENYPVLAD